MKILFLSDHFHPEPSAPAAHVYERARLWVAAGHAVTVITAAPNFPEGRVHAGYRNAWRSIEMLDGIRVVRVKTFITRNEGYLLRIVDYASYAASALVQGLRELRPEVVISSSPHLFVAVAGVLLARWRRVPHVFELRDLWPASIAANTSLRQRRVIRWLERLELWLYRASTRVLAFTPSFRRHLIARGIAADKIDVVINGANLELFSPPLPADRTLLDDLGLRGRFVIGYLGTLGLSQGLENVIAAAALLRGSRATFLFVGVGAAKTDLERAATESGLDNVIFVARQPKEAMPRYWSVCDVALVHLKDDPVFATVIPSKIFEAMAVRRPILYVGRAGDGSEIVERHGVGIRVPPGDPAALADAALALAGNPGGLARMAAAAAAAAPEYSRQRQAEASLAVLARAIASVE